MSAAWCDFDNDGRLDIYIPSMWEAAGQRVSTQKQFHAAASDEIRVLYQRHAQGNAIFNRAAGVLRFQLEEEGAGSRVEASDSNQRRIADLVEHSSSRLQELMWARYGDYLSGFKGDEYRDHVLTYVDHEDTPAPLIQQLDLLTEVGFTRLDVIHKHSCFAAFCGVKPS